MGRDTAPRTRDPARPSSRPSSKKKRKQQPGIIQNVFSYLSREVQAFVTTASGAGEDEDEDEVRI
jgi:hypothetical protein